jgi:ABC-type multidrug transport system permease subunit
MRVVLNMVRKDVLRKLRSPLGIVVLLLFPVLFSVIISLVFGGDDVPRVYLLVENRDESVFGNAVMSALGSNEVAQYFDVDVVGEEGAALMEKGKASALLQIPENFTLDLIEGKQTQLRLIRNPAQGILPEVAEQVAGVLAEVLSAGSRVLRGPMDNIAPLIQNENAEISEELVVGVASAVYHTVDGAEKFLMPPVITLNSFSMEESEEEDEQQYPSSRGLAFSIFLFVFPGISVYTLFLIGDTAMRDILVEAEDGTLARQLQGPIGTRTLVFAKALLTLVICLLALLILALIGWIARGSGVDRAGFIVHSLALIVAIAGSGATIYGAAGTQRRGATISSVAYLFLGFAGGSFIRVETMPAGVRAISPFSPFYWGAEGFKTLLERNGGLADVMQPVGILLALGVALLLLGSWLLTRRLERGGAT